MDVRDEFWTAAAELIHRAAKADAISRDLPYAELLNDPPASLQQQLIDENTLRITVENRAQWRRFGAKLSFTKPLKGVKILTAFPLRPAGSGSEGWNVSNIASGDTTFSVPLPPRGVTVLETYFFSREKK